MPACPAEDVQCGPTLDASWPDPEAGASCPAPGYEEHLDKAGCNASCYGNSPGAEWGGDGVSDPDRNTLHGSVLLTGASGFLGAQVARACSHAQTTRSTPWLEPRDRSTRAHRLSAHLVGLARAGPGDREPGAGSGGRCDAAHLGLARIAMPGWCAGNPCYPYGSGLAGQCPDCRAAQDERCKGPGMCWSWLRLPRPTMA